MAEDYKGSITLASIVDGESGQPGRGIDNTVIEYAVSTNGSTAPSSGWSTTYPTYFDLGKFLWIRTTVNYTSGNPSISYTVSYKGTNGTSYYTYVRYSKNSSGNPMVTEPTSETKYIGLYSGTSSSAPTSYGSYTWSKYAGDDGAPGEPGDDGKTYYTWIKYASSASPSAADMSDSPTGKSYIGIAYNKESQTESSVPSDYTWSKYVGEDGAPGNSVASISEYYGLSNASTAVPTQWYSNVQTATASNRYLWNYEIVNYTQTASTSTDPKVIGMYSEDGQPGAAGRGISGIVNYYLATSSTAVETTSTGWTSTVQTATETKLYLWNYEKITYTAAPTVEYTKPCVISNYAKDGDDAPWVTLTGATNIITYNGNTSTTTPSSSFTVVGATNSTISSWQYSVNGGSYSNTVPAGLSRSNNTVTVNPLNFTNKTVAIKAATSAPTATDVFTITKVSDGTNVTIASEEVKYAVSSSGTVTPTPESAWSSAIPSVGVGSYLWTRTKVNYSPSGNTTSYSVAYNGDDGNSVNSIAYYYAATTSNAAPSAASITSTSFPSNFSATNKYVWRKEVIDYSKIADKTTVTLYAVWGDTGRAITGVAEKYKKSSSSTTAPTGTWSDSPESLDSTNKYLWNYEIISYSDSTTQETAKKVVAIYTEDGDAGKGITSITNWYLATNESNAANLPPKGATPWTTTIQAVSSSAKYLWNYEVIAYTEGDPTSTNPAIIGMYAKDGDDAVQIILSNESHTLTATSSGVVESYNGASTNIQVFEGTTDKTSDYTVYVSDSSTGSKTVNNITVSINNSVNPRVVTVTAVPTTFTSNVVPIVVKKGTTALGTKNFSISMSKAGVNGSDGIGINTAASETKYAIDSQGSAPPSSGWSTSWPSTIPQGSYLWTWIHLVYTDNTSSDEYTVTYQGEDGSERILIESSDEMIYKFYTAEGNKLYSPNTITFWARETGGSSILVPGVDYDHELELIGTSVTDYKHLWNFFSRLYGQTVPSSVEESVIHDTVLNLVRSISNNQIVFNIDILSTLTLEIGPGKTSEADAELFNTFRQILYDINYYFNFKVYNHSTNVPPIDSDLLAQKPIGVEFGTNDEMAQFALTATNINMLVRDTKLNFDASGLHLVNGAFDIIDNGYHIATPSEEEFNTDKTQYYTYDNSTQTYVQCTAASSYDATIQYYTFGNIEMLAYVPEQQILRVNGSGKFTGTIEATDGYFSGELRGASGTFEGAITAQSGSIGGWIIQEQGLYSTAQDDAHISLIELNGTTGIINARNINLGVGAHIEQYLELGNNSYLYNSDLSQDGKVLQVPGTTLYANGKLSIGDISFLGAESKIIGNNWNITPNLAEFSNVNISGKIQSAVFEVNSTAAVGGLMLFKPSYKVVSTTISDTIQFNLDSKYTGLVGDIFVTVNTDGNISEQYYQITSIDNDDFTITTENNGQISSDFASSINGVIILGQISGANTEIAIGINSTSSRNALLIPRGITVSELFDNTGEDEIYSIGVAPKIFLGDLAFLNIENVSGFGLYGNNVYLTGSLTTQITSNDDNESYISYAGVNTLDGVPATVFGDTDRSNIVFWAGSAGINATQIQNSPFQVTKNGSLYAYQGKFEGSVITDSIIQGSIIRTARLEGTEESPALKIFDANKGIGFYQTAESNGDEIFTIGANGFMTNNRYFISINANGSAIDINVDTIFADTYSTINTNGVILETLLNKIQSKYNNQVVSKLELTNNEIIGSFVDTSINEFSIARDIINLNTNTVALKSIVVYGANVMKYEPVTNGYNLYVTNN